MDVITVGAANVDIVATAEEVPPPDGERPLRDMAVVAGGSAANVAVGASRLGLEAGFVGRIGDDELAPLVERHLAAEGVDCTHAVRGGDTGVAVALRSPEEGRRLLTYNDAASLDVAVPESYLARADHAFMAGVTADGAVDEFAELAALIAGAGTRLVFDPGAVFTRHGVERLGGILEHCDTVIASEQEVADLTGADYRAGGRTLLAEGPEQVIVTRGGDGAALVTREQVQEFPAAPVEEVADTVGAGDAFAAGFIAARQDDAAMDDAVAFANRVAAASLGGTGAQSVPPRDALGGHQSS